MYFMSYTIVSLVCSWRGDFGDRELAHIGSVRDGSRACHLCGSEGLKMGEIEQVLVMKKGRGGQQTVSLVVLRKRREVRERESGTG